MSNLSIKEVDRLMQLRSMADGVIACLIGNDHFADMSKEVVANCLWVIGDCLSQMERIFSNDDETA